MSDQVRVEWTDGDGLGKILRSPRVVATCREKAEKVLQRAKDTAPVDTGAYKASLHIEVEPHAHRDTYAVVADVPYAVYVESRHGTLARAMQAGR